MTTTVVIEFQSVDILRVLHEHCALRGNGDLQRDIRDDDAQRIDLAREFFNV